MANMPMDQQVKNKLVERRQPKRKTMTFGELSDIVIEKDVQTTEDLWAEAKKRKVSGDDTLWNKCGDDKHLSQTLKKILNGWYGDPSSTLRSTTPYTLDMFYVPKEAQLWLDGAYKHRTLILSGPGGIGKTSLATCLLLAVCKRFHFITRLDELRSIDIGKNAGLLWDEANMRNLDVDQMKAVMDLEHTRTIHCRNTDGCLPKNCARIFSCNHTRLQMFGDIRAEHTEAIDRRHLWTQLVGDTRKARWGHGDS